MKRLLLLAGQLGWAGDDVAFSVLPGRSRLREIEKILAAEHGLQTFINNMLGLLRTWPLPYNHRLLLA